jgi:hypothetical protein
MAMGLSGKTLQYPPVISWFTIVISPINAIVPLVIVVIQVIQQLSYRLGAHNVGYTGIHIQY